MLSSRVKFAIIILLAIMVLYILYKCLTKTENLVQQPIIGWSRNQCPYIIGETYENIFKKYGIKQDDKKWSLYLPCNYDDPNKEVDSMPSVKGAKYFIINNCDMIVAKDELWKGVVDYYGMEKAKTMLPSSYVLNLNKDLERFNREYDSNKLYIMKKNIQRQEGLKITNDKNEILNGRNEKYVIVQELLDDPYIISTRKTNMRFYVLVICQNNKASVYVHKEGFMYYTKVPFVKKSLDSDVNITTGYIDRAVYDTNPLRHGDLRKYLDNPNRGLLNAEHEIKNKGLQISKIYFEKIYDLIRNVFAAFTGHFCKPNKLSNNTTFQLFGVDIAVDDKLNVKLLEANKGPDLGAKDKRDQELKQIVLKDVFQLVNIINTNDTNGFIKLI